MRLIGLDFEASGTDPWGTAAPIQIGVAVYQEGLRADRILRTHDIGGWDFKNEYEWNPKSEEIHGITLQRLSEAEPAWKVDIRLAEWLLDMAGSRMWNITVGWNVAGFDRQFITRHFPNLNKIFSYRTIDLNALVFDRAMQRAADTPTAVQNHYKAIKAQAKKYAQEQMEAVFDEPKWHDAGYDALAALFSLRYLQKETA